MRENVFYAFVGAVLVGTALGLTREKGGFWGGGVIGVVVGAVVFIGIFLILQKYRRG